MAEKRGQYQYNDDGTVSQLVHNTNETAETSMIGVDFQAQGKVQIESNTTPLGISATYTGAGFDTMKDGENYNWLTGTVTSDQTGTLYVQQSIDGTNWVSTDSVSVTNNPTSGNKIAFDILLRYVRFTLVNNAVAQTQLKLYGFVTFK
jgi:hypothetical protein